MTTFGNAVAWLVLSPLAFVTNIIAIVIICHYRAQFHGTDVAFISLFVSMVTHVAFVLPIPAVVAILDEGWMSELCSFYVWLVLCVRMSELIVIVIMNIHWMCILRFTSGQEVYSSATVVKILVIVAWFGSVVTGLVPVTGSTFYTFYDAPEPELVFLGAGNPNRTSGFTSVATKAECRFLPHGIGSSFVLFFIISTLAALTVSLVASSDTLTVFRYMRRTAIDKYKAGRFYLPSNAAATSYSRPGPHVWNGSGGRGNGGAPHPSGRHLDGQEYAGEERLGSDGDDDVTSARLGEREVKATSTTNSDDHHGASQIGATSSRYPSTPNTHPHTSNGSVASPISSSARPNGRNSDTFSSTPSRKGVPNSAAAVVVRPSSKSGVARATATTVHARYNELSLSAELCRVVLCYTLLTGLIQHLPFVILQFVQLVEPVDSQNAETVVLWLILVQCLLSPHVLWFLSRRYRHALVYTWAVHVLRDASAREEDPSACTLQSYTRKVRTPDGAAVHVTARVRGHIPVTTMTASRNHYQHQPNGSAVVERTDIATDDTAGEGTSGHTGNHVAGRARANGRIITTDLDDGMTVITNLGSNQVTYIYDNGADRLSSKSSDHACARSPQLLDSSGNSRRSSQTTTSPSRSSLGTPSRGSEIRRTSSSRQVWKEQMRKKHLPAIFVNEAFDAEEGGQRIQSEIQQLPDVTNVPVNGDGDAAAATSSGGNGGRSVAVTGQNEQGFHYYMSSDFHHDYLRSDSLPTMVHQESESDGASFQYDDRDIEGILDREHSSRSGGSTTLTSFHGNSGNQHVHVQRNGSQPIRAVQSVNSARTSLQNPSETSFSQLSSEGDHEYRQGGTTPAGMKPPRRSSPALRQGSRTPSLHHQRMLHRDPDSDQEDAVDNAHAPFQNSEHSTATEHHNGLSSVSYTGSALASDPSNNEEESSEHPEGDISHDHIPVVNGTGESLMQPGVHEITSDGSASDFDSLVSSEAVNPAFTSAVIDTDDVYLRIDYVTDEETNTDDRFSPNPSPSENISETEFRPQSGTSVMGLLLEEASNDAVLGSPEGDIRVQGSSESETKPMNPAERWASQSGTDSGQGESGSEQSQSVVAGVLADDSDDDHHEDGQRKESMITRVHSGVSPPPTAVVLDIVETSSTGSDHSVVLELYNENRRPPWMDDDLEKEESYSRTYFGNPFSTNVPNSSSDSDVWGSSGDFGASGDFGGPFGFGDSTSSKQSNHGNPFRISDPFRNRSTDFAHEPLLSESDTDTPQSSANSGQLKGMRELNATLFDHETEMGFEDALAVDNMVELPHYYGNVNLCFESIEEEAEEFSDSLNSSNKESDDSIFKTQVIVSRPSSRNGIVESGANHFLANSSPSSGTNPFTSQQTDVGPVWGTLLSPTSRDVNPFETAPALARTVADGRESADFALTASAGEEASTNGDVISPGSERKPVTPKISLTKPTLWPSARTSDVTSGSKDLGFDSDFSQAPVSYGDALKGTSGGENNVVVPRRRPPPPPPPPKPNKLADDPNGRRSESPKSNVNPVYF